MTHLRASLTALALGLAVAVSGACSAAAYAAIVNGHRLSQNSLFDELKAIRGNTDFLKAVEQGQTKVLGAGRGTFDTTFTAKVLTRAIYYQLVHAELTRRKLHVSAADLNAARQSTVQQVAVDQNDPQSGTRILAKFPKGYRDTLVRRTAEVTVLQKALAGTISESDALAYYGAHKAEFEQVCASHILVDSKAKADDIEARLAKGEDFAAVAKAESKDPGSGPKGGDLGCATPDTYVSEFANAVRTLPVGQLSPPVQTQFGFHVIKVTDRKVPPYEQVADQVRQRLQQAGNDKLTTWLTDALHRVKVRTNPKFGSWAPNAAEPQVQPPAAPKAVRGATTPTTAGLTPEP